MPSITAQSTPPLLAAFFRFAANFGERRVAGGVGSGRGVFSQIVAAFGGPSISGFGAGFVVGSSTLRSCCHWACASLRRLPERFAPREPGELLVVLEDESCADDGEPLLTCVKPLSEVPAVESATAGEAVEADSSAVGAGAAEASLEDADSSAAGAADSSAAGAASDDDSSAVVVVDSIAAEWSSAIVAEKRSPANAASEAPAKNSVVKTKVVASRRFRLGSPACASSGDGLPPKSQLSLRVNHRGIAVSSFWIEPLAATRGAELACDSSAA